MGASLPSTLGDPAYRKRRGLADIFVFLVPEETANTAVLLAILVVRAI